MMENWDDLRHFLAVARAGTYAGAAEALDLDASTILRRLRGLEARLGVRLLERRGRGSGLTEAGEQLVVHSEEIEETVLGIERSLAGRDLEVRGTLRVTTPDTLASGFLGPLLRRFREAHPGIVVELLVDNRYYRLGRGEADVALRAGDRPTEPEVVAKAGARVAGALYASRAYLERRGNPASLESHDFVGFESSLAGIPYARLVHSIAAPDRITVRVTSVLAAASAVEAGLGVSALPCFLADGRSEIVRLRRPDPELETTLWILRHRDLRQTARVRAFTDLLAGELEARRIAFAGKRPGTPA